MMCPCVVSVNYQSNHLSSTSYNTLFLNLIMLITPVLRDVEASASSRTVGARGRAPRASVSRAGALRFCVATRHLFHS